MLHGDGALAALAGGGVALVMHLLGFAAFGILGAGIAGPILVLLLRRVRHG